MSAHACLCVHKCRLKYVSLERPGQAISVGTAVRPPLSISTSGHCLCLDPQPTVVITFQPVIATRFAHFFISLPHFYCFSCLLLFIVLFFLHLKLTSCFLSSFCSFPFLPHSPTFHWLLPFHFFHFPLFALSLFLSVFFFLDFLIVFPPSSLKTFFRSSLYH